MAAAAAVWKLTRQTVCRTSRQWRCFASSSSTVAAYKPGENFFEKNERLNRPMSPHITIYRFELPAIMSITHRCTGLFLSAGVYGLGLYSLVSSGSFPQLVDSVQSMHVPSAAIWCTKYAVAWPLVYHTLNGIRHLFWDAGYGFEMKTLYKSGYFVTLTSIIVAALAASK